jgi:hypothetical protein
MAACQNRLRLCLREKLPTHHPPSRRAPFLSPTPARPALPTEYRGPRPSAPRPHQAPRARPALNPRGGPKKRTKDSRGQRRLIKTAWSARPTPRGREGFSLEDDLRTVKNQVVHGVLRKTRGNQSQAARLLGVPPQAVSKLLKRTGPAHAPRPTKSTPPARRHDQ